MQIPSSLTSGDRWSWSESLTDYPASLYTLTFYFRGPKSFNAAGAASGADHVFTVAATATAEIRAGAYDWIARVVLLSDATTVETIEAGRLTVATNLADSSIEHRSFWRRVLDELEPVILGRAGTDQLSMSIAGRSLQRMSWDELLKVYDRANLEVARDQGDSAGKYVVSPIRP